MRLLDSGILLVILENKKRLGFYNYTYNKQIGVYITNEILHNNND